MTLTDLIFRKKWVTNKKCNQDSFRIWNMCEGFGRQADYRNRFSYSETLWSQGLEEKLCDRADY